MSSYRDVKAWQRGMDLVDEVYAAVRMLPKTEMFLLSAQMRSAALSIPSNIAEGKGRRSERDYRHFVIQARGSVHELETEILIATRQRYIDCATSESLLRRTGEVGRLINGLIEYLDSRIGDFQHLTPDT